VTAQVRAGLPRKLASRRSFAFLPACAILVLSVSISRAAPAPAPSSLLGPAPADGASPLDVRACRAIRAALDYLYRNQADDGSWDNKYSRQQPGGGEALALLTALTAGEDPARPQLAKALKYLETISPPRTVYVRAVRALVYARMGPKYAAALEEDARWLADNMDPAGGWGYGPVHPTTKDNPRWTDLSNTFLATLALRRAGEAGATIKPGLWPRCRKYWAGVANADGGFSYQPPGGTGFRLRGSSYGSMTAAGIAACYLVCDAAAAEDEPPFAPDRTNRAANPLPLRRQINGAAKWLADNFSLDKNPRWVWVASESYEYYYLYCLQHLADEAGIAAFRSTDLARASAELVLSNQRPDGCWQRRGGDAAADSEEKQLVTIRTCFAILALARCRGPELIQKLRLPGDADTDARDAANLTRWLGKTLGWQAAWRELALDGNDAAAGTLCPILYVQTSLRTYPDALADRLRRFVAAGGAVVFQPFAGEPQTVKAASAWLQKAFPEMVAKSLADNHPIFTAYFLIPAAAQPKVIGLGDSTRTRVFLLASDVSGAWHQGRTREHPHLFQLAANILLYTTDLQRPPGKLRGPAATGPAPATPDRFLAYARVQYGGDWNVAPAAVTHVSAALAAALSVGAKELPAVDLSKPVSPSVPMLWLTGTAPPKLTDPRKAVLKEYLAAGGTLLVDSAMGEDDFVEAAVKMLADMFGPGSVREVAPDSPLLTGQFGGGMGADLTAATCTRATTRHVNGKPPKLKGLYIEGRLAGVISPYGISVPAGGESAFGCKGLSPADARRLIANMLLMSATTSRTTAGAKPR
jgi:hypothetical protein